MQELKEYQEVSHRAQLEIAETFFSMGSYEQAAKFFKRLLRIDLFEEDRKNVLFKYAYTIYLSGDFLEAAGSLRDFVREFPASELTAEARYLLSDAYLRLNDPKRAMKETLELLTAEVSKINTKPEAWLYWKKRTGNKLANQFYEDGNYIDALTIYQAMVDISQDLTWCSPVLYQIGLCYERLDMKPKAVEAYQEIVEAPAERIDSYDGDLTLKSIHEMAMWRVDRINADITLESDLKEILENA